MTSTNTSTSEKVGWRTLASVGSVSITKSDDGVTSLWRHGQLVYSHHSSATFFEALDDLVSDKEYEDLFEDYTWRCAPDI